MLYFYLNLGEPMSLQKTEEQIKIIQASKTHPKLKINAAAGSGKTSTLVMVSEENPVKSLYLAFNKNMAEEAAQRFPAHVEVRTTHSLAYKTCGVVIAHKLRRPAGGYKNVCGTGSEIARHFKLAPFVVTNDKSISAIAMGNAVKRTLANFEYSADREVMKKHVSYVECEKVSKVGTFDRIKYADRILRYAQQLWEMRINPNNDVLATHDTYLKLYQLSDPDLSFYKIIYLDESQDSNECVLDVLLKQEGRVVLVGDARQAIYGWRGAVNAMERVKWPELKLTKSFRFGQEVADIANKVLLNDAGVVDMDIRGFEKMDTKVLMENPNEEYTWIFRTNAEMLATAVELILENRDINIQADISDYISLVESVLALRDDKKKNVKHIDVIPFDTWNELAQDVEHSSSGELKRVYKQVLEGKAYQVVNVLKQYVPTPNAKIRLISGHKSKGLEFDHVVLAHDFKGYETDDQGNYLGFSNPQEQNLLYVAATRAKKSLTVNQQILDILNFLQGSELKEAA
jgi:superfamily I DNA/RNA helicase